MKRKMKLGGSVAIDTVPLPEKTVIKRSSGKGSMAIDTVPLPERNARLATEMLKAEIQLGQRIAAASSDADVGNLARRVRQCSFRPHYRAGMTQSEAAQATCDAIEAWIACIVGRSRGSQ